MSKPESISATAPAVAAISKPRADMTIKEKADADKASLIARAQDYVAQYADGPEADPRDSIKAHRATVTGLIGEMTKFGREGNFDAAFDRISGAMRALETTREAKTGVQLTEIPVEGGVPILIRDARNREERPVRGTEAFEIQYLNYIRGAMEVAVIEGKPELRAQLVEKAAEFMKTFHKAKDGVVERDDMPAGLDERIAAEKKLAKELGRAIEGVSSFLEEQGIPNADNKANVAKEYQNLRNSHFNIVTLSSVPDANGTRRTVMEAEVAMKGLTAEQKGEYAAIRDESAKKPAWFAAMPWWEQELVKEHAPTIEKGEHVLSTWLLHGSGMKNAFEKVTAVAEADGSLTTVATSKHSGTLASIARDPADRERVARMNIEQARQWLGSDVNLDIVTFNTATIGKSHDPVITGQMSTIGNDETIGVRHTNLAFNIGRAIGAASMLTGVNRNLAEVSGKLGDLAEKKPEAAKAISFIQSRLEPQPKGIFGGLRRFFSNLTNPRPEEKVQSLAESGAITKDDAKVLNAALQLRRDVDEVAMTTRLFRAGNASRAVAVGFEKMLRFNRESSDSALGIPKREPIGMCTSGKDRTGDYGNNVSVDAVAGRLGVSTGSVHKAIVPSGHTAQQAGGVYSCGATAGCNGIRIDGAWGHGNILIAVLRGAVFGKLRTGRMGDERAMVDMVEYAAHGTRDHLHTAEKGATDLTFDGLDKETAHGKEVAAKKAAAATAQATAAVSQPAQQASVAAQIEPATPHKAAAINPTISEAVNAAVAQARAAISANPSKQEGSSKGATEAAVVIPEGAVKKTRVAFEPKMVGGVAGGFADKIAAREAAAAGHKGGDSGRGG